MCYGQGRKRVQEADYANLKLAQRSHDVPKRTIKTESPMNSQTAADFIESFYEDVATAMSDANCEPIDFQYKLGVRRLAWAFFNKFELFEIDKILPNLANRDVDAWFSGQE